MFTLDKTFRVDWKVRFVQPDDFSNMAHFQAVLSGFRPEIRSIRLYCVEQSYYNIVSQI